MAEKPASSITEKSSTVVKPGRQLQVLRWSYWLTASSALVSGLLMVFAGGWVGWMENQVITTWFQIRGSTLAPDNIVIVAIDDQSISVPEQSYQTDPVKYANLEPLKSFPYKREAYSQIIEKLVKAGAKTIALDVVFDQPSIHGKKDDINLQTVLKKYGDKVVLAGIYQDSETHQGKLKQFLQPEEMLRQTSASIGVVNFPIELDGKIHRLGSELIQESQEKVIQATKISSFAEVVLKVANIKYETPKGDRIYFWGKEGTFTTVPLWYIFDSENWNGYLQKGEFFANKIVLVGATAKLTQDSHPVAISANERMSGVEIHANAIATLMNNKSIVTAIPHPMFQGVFVMVLVGSTGLVITICKKQSIPRFLLSIGVAISWGVISYISFNTGKTFLPTTIPIIAITINGVIYLGIEAIKNKINQAQLITIFRKYHSSPIVQEIINQQDELQTLIEKRDLELNGKILAGHYQIIKVLGAGGFSETYIAEDIHRPDHPQCVVKQLKPSSSKSESLALARRLFDSEAKTLEKLGTHSQIPQLLAYFEENQEFYLVQEYILGHPLNKELIANKPFTEAAVIELLQDLLNILRFIHENDVIHRDIKPSNIIRRHSDWKLVLIDFGAVKEMTTQIMDNLESTAFTIGIGTKGYAPSEQCFGRPQFNSDIYALGMIAIKALTGISPHELKHDQDDNLLWQDKATVSDELVSIINKMVLDDYKQRYKSALEVLEDIDKLRVNHYISSLGQIDNMNHQINDHDLVTDPDAATTPWLEDG